MLDVVCCSYILLFNVFLVAILIIGLQRKCSLELGILKDLTHLKEQSTTPGTKTELANVRRAVWSMLYADDACVVARSRQSLAKMMSMIVQICSAFALTICI